MSNDTRSSEFPLFPVIRLEEFLDILAMNLIFQQGSHCPESVYKVTELQPYLRTFRNDQMAAAGDPDG
jgi:hypothetical protein